jgi:hypothetical protein
MLWVGARRAARAQERLLSVVDARTKSAELQHNIAHAVMHALGTNMLPDVTPATAKHSAAKLIDKINTDARAAWLAEATKAFSECRLPPQPPALLPPLVSGAKLGPMLWAVLSAVPGMGAVQTEIAARAKRETALYAQLSVAESGGSAGGPGGSGGSASSVGGSGGAPQDPAKGADARKDRLLLVDAPGTDLFEELTALGFHKAARNFDEDESRELVQAQIEVLRQQGLIHDGDMKELLAATDPAALFEP